MVREHLGAGGMGDVYRVGKYNSPEEFALKQVVRKPEYTESDWQKIRHRFCFEVKNLARIDHPNVVKFIDFQDDGDQLCLLMEYIKGMTIDQCLQFKSFRLDEILFIARRICRGLVALHQEGIIHRDLSTRNVLLADDRVVLIDFGISFEQNVQHRITRPGGLLGSPAYMAPERISNHPQSSAIDQYSLGILLFIMVTGESPFQGSFHEVLAKHLFQPAPNILECLQPGQVNDTWLALADIIETCLQKSPRKRFPSVLELQAALEAIGATTPEWSVAA